MYGLVKVAWDERKIFDAAARFSDMAEKTKMDPAEFNRLQKNLWEELDLKPQYHDSVPTESAYVDPRAVKEVKDKGVFGSSSLPDEGLVRSSPNKEVLYHEVGHAQDPKAFDSIKRGRGAITAGTNVGFYGGLSAPLAFAAENKEGDPLVENGHAIGLGTGLGAAALGGGISYYGGRQIEGAEDRANKWVMDRLTKELGSPEKAREAFENSPLPHGRQTYRTSTGINARNAAISGLLGTGLGYGLSGIGKEN